MVHTPSRLQFAATDGGSFKAWCLALWKTYKENLWWSIFWSMCWGFWLWRNAWIFNQKRKSLEEVVHKAVGIVGEYENMQAMNQAAGSGEQVARVWTAPRVGVWKLKSDASKGSNEWVGLGVW